MYSSSSSQGLRKAELKYIDGLFLWLLPLPPVPPLNCFRLVYVSFSLILQCYDFSFYFRGVSKSPHWGDYVLIME